MHIRITHAKKKRKVADEERDEKEQRIVKERRGVGSMNVAEKK
jgi:hypothetical protein